MPSYPWLRRQRCGCVLATFVVPATCSCGVSNWCSALCVMTPRLHSVLRLLLRGVATKVHNESARPREPALPASGGVGRGLQRPPCTRLEGPRESMPDAGGHGMPTHSVLPEDEVRERVQQALETGRLPLLRPARINAGYGSRGICCACVRVIDTDKIEYEVASPDNLQKLIFHFACYVIWQRECSARMQHSMAPGAPRGEETKKFDPESGDPSARREADSTRCLWLAFHRHIGPGWSMAVGSITG